MFNERQNWFRPKSFGWGITPTGLKGWLYTGGWTVFSILPGLFFLKIRKPVFGLIWISAVTTAFTVDVWLILRKIKKAKSNVTVVRR